MDCSDCIKNGGDWECDHINCHKGNQEYGKWVRISGYITPGGDPVWACSKCGKGIHVYGIEHGSYGSDIADHQWVACPNCGIKMMGEQT